MELEKGVILERINRKEEEMERYRGIARNWERMWKGDPGFGRSLEEAVRNGQEQVVTPLPFNTVNLAQRLMATLPQINVPPTDMLDKEALQDAQLKEQWLTAMWPRVHQQQFRNVVAQMTMHILLRGRTVVEVKWVKDVLPKRLAKSFFPISIRAIEPMCVGYERGPHYTKWAYYRREIGFEDALQMYPGLKNDLGTGALSAKVATAKANEQDLQNISVMVTDMWYVDQDSGKIGNVLLVDDEYVTPKKGGKLGPHLTDYPDIPYIIGIGDFGPGVDDEYDGISILHPLMGTWEYQCRLLSQMATGVLWDYWPMRLIQNEFGEDVGDIEIGPGVQQEVPWGTKVEIIHAEQNNRLANDVYQQIDAGMQQATFPGVLYGQAPGDLQAGYGVSLLADAAKGRIKNFLDSMQMTLATANGMALALVEEFGGKEGVTLWGMSETEKAPYRLTLTKKDIKGNYENEVVLTPQIPQDQIQKQTIGIRLNESGAISQQTNRDSFVGVPLPQDEESRIILDEALHSDELRPWRLRTAVQNFFKDKDEDGNAEWQKVLVNSPLMPPPPEGYHWMPDGTLMKGEEMGGEMGMGQPPQGMGPPPGQPPGPGMMPPSGPGGPPPGGPPPGGPPPGMEGPPSGPPPQEMMGPPPEMMADSGMAPPPGGPPPDMMGAPGGPPMGPPPDMMGGPPMGGSQLPPGLPTPEQIRNMSPEQLIQMLMSLPPELLLVNLNLTALLLTISTEMVLITGNRICDLLQVPRIMQTRKYIKQTHLTTEEYADAEKEVNG